jgi:protein TonB
MSSPVTKENESLVASPTSAARPDETAGRAQPVALEVPVSVNGARTVDGSDKREPFSESTKTVLVFGNGAVIRLTSSVAPGQLLFLTNEKTKKEVVCQVVKSKNYRNVSGYVELEFTEPVVGFWGIRFPTDKPASAPSAPVAPPAPQPVAVKPAAPVPQAPVAAKPPAPVIPIAPKPESVISSTALNSSSPNSSTLSLPRVSDLKSTNMTPKPVTPVVPPVSGTTSSPRSPEVQAPAPPASKIPSVPAAPDDSMEALRQQTARLQEELSGLQFAGSTSQKSASPAAEKPSRVVEMAKADVAPAPTKLLLESEDEVKIPSWLEPLARNAAAPASTQDLIEREKAKHVAALTSKPEVEELAADPTPATVAAAEVAAEVPVPSFSGSFLVEENSSSGQEASGSRGSNKGMLIGAIAAAIILLAGGGYWFSTRKPSSASGTTAAASAPLASNSNSLQSQPQGLSASQPNSAANSVATPAASTPAASPVSNSSPAASNPAPAANLVNTNIKTEVARSAPPVQPPSQQPQSQSKKTSLGQVHLAAPTVNRSAVAAEPAPNLEGASSLSAGEPLSSGLPGAMAKQPSAPSAPLPVGGDVKPARQISTVPPVYPSLAKSQHVSGDVKIDALIDATGRVTTMKVISGNTLLHQAAMDALHQWRYQPATLDGKPVPMHLTVTIQFRMQQ